MKRTFPSSFKKKKGGVLKRKKRTGSTFFKFRGYLKKTKPKAKSGLENSKGEERNFYRGQPGSSKLFAEAGGPSKK